MSYPIFDNVSLGNVSGNIKLYVNYSDGNNLTGIGYNNNSMTFGVNQSTFAAPEMIINQIGDVSIIGNVSTGGNLVVNSTTASTSTTTGALRVAGGVGILGNLNVGGNLNIGGITTCNNTLTMNQTAAIISNATIASTTTTTGALRVAGGVGIQGNLNIGGLTNHLYDTSFNGNAQILSQTASTSTSSGALRVAGGVGIQGNLNVGGFSNFVFDSSFNGNIQLTQSNNPLWFVTNNTSTINSTLASGTDVGIFYGTTNPAAAGLVISPRGTGGGIKMATNGNVGIGKNPTEKLDVNGMVRSTDLRIDNGTIHLGQNAGLTSQGANSIAIGYSAGQTTQGIRSIAIGDYAGQTSLGVNSIAIGVSSNGTGGNSIAIGVGATTGTGGNSIAIGAGATTGTGGNSIAIGVGANTGNFGNSVAIGVGATCTAGNTIVLGTASETINIPGETTATGSITANGGFTTSSTINIKSTNLIHFGSDVAGKETNAGKMGYQTFASGSLDIVGAGTAYPNRLVRVYDALTTTTLTATGNVNTGDSLYFSAQLYGGYYNRIGQYSDNIGFYGKNGSINGFVENDSANAVNLQNFTGQHRSFIENIPFENISKYKGLIVSSNKNEYISMSGGIKKGNEAITQNESLPYVSLCLKDNDKACFGVISDSEDPENRIDGYGAFFTSFIKESGDTRIFINSLGEGAIWVSNKNGILEAGDYMTTSDIPGYGMKQADDILHNYTVSKITMDCDFNPSYQPVQTILKDENGNNILDEYNQIQWTNKLDDTGNIVYEYAYNIRYVLQDGTIITKEEYYSKKGNNETVYITAFVGCTYHCG